MLSQVRLFATPWSVSLQAPLFMEFSKQQYWCRLPFPIPEDLADPGIKPMSLASPTLAGGFFTTEPPEMRVRSLGREDLLEKEWQPAPGFLPGKSQGQRSLAG